jgi:peptidoglycan/xylan/chitin deacetylase (PgdA/CDA1 family)
MNRVTIVMYHYVRELPFTRYPRIKGLLASQFLEQIEFMSRHYRFVTMQQCIDAVYGNSSLPRLAALLTFDDAYIDHFVTVFPLLEERGTQGCFFPPAKAICNAEVLDVNKIHFILAVAPIETVMQDIERLLDELRPEHQLESTKSYRSRFMQPGRFDSKEVIFIKRLLQYGLPRRPRELLTGMLFAKYVTKDEQSFSRELYMTPDQLRCMARNGMYIGSHGYDHFWLDTLPPEEQAREVELSKQFLAELGLATDNWVMCYPYGACNASLIEILKRQGCKLGLTTKVDIAVLSAENAFTLARLDTNDLPKARDAAPGEWTTRV